MICRAALLLNLLASLIVMALAILAWWRDGQD